MAGWQGITASMPSAPISSRWRGRLKLPAPATKKPPTAPQASPNAATWRNGRTLSDGKAADRIYAVSNITGDYQYTVGEGLVPSRGFQKPSSLVMTTGGHKTLPYNRVVMRWWVDSSKKGRS